jgi:hypothetical protein
VCARHLVKTVSDFGGIETTAQHLRSK